MKKRFPIGYFFGFMCGVGAYHILLKADQMVVDHTIHKEAVLNIANKVTNAHVDTKVAVCFSPGNNCPAEIIRVIDAARKEILVQAYSFTDTNIYKALLMAHARGVAVRVILDKTQLKIAKKFARVGIATSIDYTVRIAHNKVMIIDQKIVITGSYNFTFSAANRNAENLLILRDHAIARLYVYNWHKRRSFSTTVNG